MEELTSAAPLDDSPKYYKYVEESEERGQFYELRYRQSANIIEMFTVNSFKTYSPGGLTKVKGSASVHPQHFFRDFGVAIRLVRKWIPAFYNLIVQKFKLKIFEEPIS